MKKISENRGRVIGLLIVALFVASAFAGAVQFAKPNGPSTSASPAAANFTSSDVTIGTGYSLATWTLSNGSEYLQGNLTIASGGVLTLNNESLVFDEFSSANNLAAYEASPIYHIIVEDGGQLIMHHSTITTNLQLINSIPVLGILVQNGGTLSMYDSSSMIFPGQFVVAGGNFNMVDSAIHGFSPSAFNPHNINATFFPVGTFDNPPVTAFFGANVLMEGSQISLFQNHSTKNQSKPGNMYVENYPFAFDTANKNIVTYTIEGVPTAVNTAAPLADTTTFQNVANLSAIDGSYYRMLANQRMAVTGLTTGGVDSPLLSASLHINYETQLAAGTTLNWAYGNTSVPAGSVALPASTTSFSNASVTLPTSLTANDLSRLLLWVNATAATGTVLVNKLWLQLSFVEQAYKNLTVAGSTSFTAVDTYIGANFNPQPANHTAVMVADTAHAYFYNVQVNQSQVYNATSMNVSAFYGVSSSMTTKPLSFGPLNTGPGGNSLSLVDSNGAVFYDIPANTVLQTYGMNISADSTANTQLSSAILSVTTNTSTGVSVLVGEMGQPVASYKSTGIVFNAPTTYTVNLYNLGFKSLSNISNLVVYIQNGGTATYIKNVNVQVSMLPQVYLYRFANVTVNGKQGLPVSGSSIALYYTGSSPNNSTPGAQAGYFVAPDNTYQLTPPASVLSYLGRTLSNYNVTNQLGNAEIPLLSDTIDASTFPNSMFEGNYTAIVQYNGTNYGNSISFTPYPVVTASSEVLYDNITIGVSLPLPQIQVGTPYVVPAFLYINQTGTLTFNVSNVGFTGVNSLPINVSDGANGRFVSYYETQISVAPRSTKTISIQWYFNAPGNNTISVFANVNKTIPEVSYAGDTNSTVFYVEPDLPNLVIPSSGITFNPSPAYSGQAVTITAAIQNFLGRAPALNVTVKFYSGNPMSGGVQIGQTLFNVSAKGSNTTSISWLPTTIGSTPIYVYIDPLHSIQQYSTAGNLNDSVLDIILTIGQEDLVVNNSNSQPSAPFMITSVINMSSNVIVTQSGNLLITGGGINFIESYSTQYSFLLNQTSKVVIENSVLQSSNPINIYVYGNTQLFIIDSTIGSNVSFISGGNSHIWINSSIIQGQVSTAAFSVASIVSYNTSFSDGIVLGYNEVARLYNVSAPSVSSQASSVAYIYRWVYVTAFGRFGTTVKNATVTLMTFSNVSNPNGAFYASAKTQNGGLATFAALSDIISASADTYTGNYIVNTSYVEAGTWYAAEVPVSLAHYSVPLTPVSSRVSTYLIINLPDLSIASSGISVKTSYIVEGSTYTVNAQIYNLGFAPLDQNFTVAFTLPGQGTENVTSTLSSPLPVNSSISIQASWTVPMVTGNQTIGVSVNPTEAVPEITYGNNFAQAVFDVFSLPDLVPVSINATGSFEAYGNVTFNVAVTNFGQAPASNVTVEILDGNSSANLTNVIAGGVIPFIGGNSTYVISILWTVPQLPAGVQTEKLFFGALVNPNHTIAESTYANSNAAAPIEINITQPQVYANAQVSTTTIKSGSALTVTITVTSKTGNKPVANYPVTVILYNIRGLPQSNVKFVGQTNSQGQLTASIPIPTAESQGAYHFEVFSNGIYVTSSPSFNVASTQPNTGIQTYQLLIIIVAAIGAFVGFSVYLYRYGLARVVECGNCGAFIPETSRKCQYCGVEFESGTAKCSNCSSWIPATSKQCPICGVKFADEGDGEEEDEISSEMSKGYAAFVEKFKGQAKIDLGNKYNEKSFLSWWKKQPTYLTFEDWLSRQQEVKKATMIDCPVCGEPNPKSSQECLKCGSTLAKDEPPKSSGPSPPPEPAQPAAKPQQAPVGKPAPQEPRRVVVPRRIIRKVEDKPPAPPENKPQEETESGSSDGEEGSDQNGGPVQ